MATTDGQAAKENAQRGQEPVPDSLGRLAESQHDWETNSWKAFVAAIILGCCCAVGVRAWAGPPPNAPGALELDRTYDYTLDEHGNVIAGNPPPKTIGPSSPDFLGGPLTADQQLRWDGYVRALRTNLPPVDGEVIVRIEVLDSELAYTMHDGKNFVIVIDSRLCFYSKRDALIHEWAHALDWWTGGNEDDHGPAWALQYGRCYQAVMKARYRE